jgi:hypothetical protein
MVDIIDDPPLFGRLGAEGPRKGQLASYETVGAIAISAIGSLIGVAELASFEVAGIAVTQLAGATITLGSAVGLSALLKTNVLGQRV